jgi:hypothetical protein
MWVLRAPTVILITADLVPHFSIFDGVLLARESTKKIVVPIWRINSHSRKDSQARIYYPDCIS